MRRQFVLLSVSVCVGLSLSGCIRAAMGPDLPQRPSPFPSSGTVHVMESRGMTDTVISPSPAGDRAVVKFFYLGDRVYNASVSYKAFTPIIPETIKDQKDYWLVGFNMSQTPDRSFYAVLRYPHGKPLEPRSTRDDFEMQVLVCPGQGMHPRPAAEADAASEVAPAEMPPARKKGKQRKIRAEAPSPAEDVAEADSNESATSEEPFCYKDSLANVEAAATEMLRSPSLRLGEANEAKTAKGGANDSPWIKLAVTAE